LEVNCKGVWPEIIYIKGCTNVVADMLSRYQYAEKVESQVEEVFVVEDQQEMFPLAFEVISEAQQEDAQLLEIACTNPKYSTKTLLHHPVIHYKNKIVVPLSLQKWVIEWYHNTLLHWKT
jgi:hypothetical protein